MKGSLILIIISVFYGSVFSQYSVFVDSLEAWIDYSVSPNEIYSESKTDSNTAEVSVRIHTTGNLVSVYLPVDVVFLLDRSPSMSIMNGQYKTRRKEAARTAIVSLIDSHLVYPADRVAFLSIADNGGPRDSIDDYCVHYDYTEFSDDSNFVNLKNAVDSISSTDASSDTVCGASDYIWDGIMDALGYIVANYRSNVPTVLIVVTDGANYSTGSVDVSALIEYVKALNDSGMWVRIFPIAVDDGNADVLKEIADSSGGKYYYCPTGICHDAFMSIGMSYRLYGLYQVFPFIPMFVDVLGPGIHYVPGSYVAYPGPRGYTPFLTVDTVTSYTGMEHTRLNFSIDTLEFMDTIEFSYQITADLSDTSACEKRSVHNCFEDDTVYYSRLKYKTYEDIVVEKVLPRHEIFVKNSVCDSLVADDVDYEVPLRFNLCQNSPNPFNSLTKIYYNTVLDQGSVKIYNIHGKLLFSQMIEGQGAVEWDAGKLPSGIYILKMKTENKNYSRKLILQR
jgi:hypothetical protein